MRKYTLLRSNKQTGPYSFDELKAMGLKVYDLVWVEGRSAAWLYAEEVAELEPFTPKIKDIVEEIFLEKRATAKIPSILEQINKSSNTATNIPAPLKEESPIKKIPLPDKAIVEADNSNVSVTAIDLKSKKSTYVQIPALKQSTDRQIEVDEHAGKENMVEKKTAITDSYKSEPNEADKELVQKLTEADASNVHIKYSRSLDDIKKEYVSKVLGNETGAVKKNAPLLMLLGIAVFLLIGVGIIIGILLGRKNHTPQAAVAQKEQNLTSQQSALKTNEKAGLPVNKIAVNKAEKVNNALQDELLEENEPQKEIGESKKTSKSNTSKSAKTDGGGQLKSKKEIPSPGDGGEIAVIPAKQTQTNDAETRKINLRDLVSITSKNYKKGGLFGGIKDVSITAFNNSSHHIDLAVVEVSYILPNGKVHKTDKLYFRNIASHSSATVKAPNSPRGSTIEAKLTLITSKSAETVSDVSFREQ
jgi:GYF domain 2